MAETGSLKLYKTGLDRYRESVALKMWGILT